MQRSNQDDHTIICHTVKGIFLNMSIFCHGECIKKAEEDNNRYACTIYPEEEQVNFLDYFKAI